MYIAGHDIIAGSELSGVKGANLKKKKFVLRMATKLNIKRNIQ
jgi:hypothetical protein